MKLTRVWWGLGVLFVLIVIGVCLVPSNEIPGVFALNDKLSHLFGHAALAIYFAGLVPRQRWWKIFVFLLLLGSAIEVAQFAMHLGREGDPRDVVANSTGAVFGLMLAWLGLARWPEFATWVLYRGRPAQ